MAVAITLLVMSAWERSPPHDRLGKITHREAIRLRRPEARETTFRS